LSGVGEQCKDHSMRRFDEVIESPQRLRALIRQSSERARNKVIDHIDQICRLHCGEPVRHRGIARHRRPA
jgi:hypothetical protein